jgi:hypothetical protein
MSENIKAIGTTKFVMHAVKNHILGTGVIHFQDEHQLNIDIYIYI